MSLFQRSEELRPGNIPKIEEIDRNGTNFNTLPRDPDKLVVISSLHPFWHTKKGSVVIGLVVLTVIGAIVGGAVGGAKAASDNHKVETVASAFPSASITRIGPQTTSQESHGSTLSLTGTTFSTTTGPSGIIGTAGGVSSTILPASRATSTSVNSQNIITSQHQSTPLSVSP